MWVEYLMGWNGVGIEREGNGISANSLQTSSLDFFFLIVIIIIFLVGNGWNGEAIH